MRPEYWNRVKELAEIIGKFYLKDRITNNGIVTLKDYDPSLHSNLEFVQIGHSGNIPKWVFEPTTHIGMLGYELPKTIVNGEMNYLIKKLDEKSPLERLDIIDEDSLLSTVKKLRNDPREVIDVIIPYNLLGDIFPYEDYPNYRHGQELSKNNIRSHWTNKFTPAESIFVSNSKLITWIQKNPKDMHHLKDQPDYLEPVVDKDKYPIQILAGETPKKPDHVYFVIRTVVAVEIPKNASLKIELPSDFKPDK